MELTEKEKESIHEDITTSISGNLNIKLAGINYFCKIASYGDDGMELIAESVANYLEINCAHYEAFLKDGDLIYLSEDISLGGIFLTAKKLGLPNYTHALEDIFKFFMSNYPDEVGILIEDIIKVYLLDVFLLNHDRHYANWGIKFLDGRPIGVFILDNGAIFKNKCQTYLMAKKNKQYILSYGSGSEVEDKIIKANIADLEYFLDEYQPEYAAIIREFYNKLTPEYLESVFVSVRSKINKNYIRYESIFLSLYRKNYEEIGQILNARNLLNRNSLHREKLQNVS